MFIHNLKYTIKTLFRNKSLIFWTFAFPIILGLFFNMAFSNIEKDEMLNTFEIAVIDNNELEKDNYYKDILETLSKEKKIFNITFTDKENADKLLDDNKIEGYFYIEDGKSNIAVKENGINETILKYVIQEIEENKIIIENCINKEVENNIKNNIYDKNILEIKDNIINKINTYNAEIEDISLTNLSYMQIEYFTLIAMACMYGGLLGLTAINNNLANMSSKGKRVAVSPTKKSIIILSSLLGSYLISALGIFILISFLYFILHVNFGSNLLLVIILSLIGSLAGISLGLLVSTCIRKDEGTKTGLIIAISMIYSVLSGMMGVTLKYVIDKNIPILNKLNPNNLITDGFYSLYYYNSTERYLNNIIYLIIFILICFIISLVSLRREKYDSI